MLSCWQEGALWMSTFGSILKPNRGAIETQTSKHSLPSGTFDEIADVRFHRARRLEEDYTESSEVLGSGCNGDVKTFYRRMLKTRSAVKRVKFAVKRLNTNTTTTPEMIRAEVQHHLKVDSPHVVKLVDVYEPSTSSNCAEECKEHVAMVMECLEGGSLFDRLKEKRRYGEEEAKVALQQVLSSIECLHSQGIVHCDVKLDNFVYDRQGSDKLKLVDFGFSQEWNPNSWTNLTESIGTLFFTAPEVLDGRYTSQCDLWSVGVISFMLMSGKIPFQNQRQISAGTYRMDAEQWFSMSSEAQDFVRSLLEVNPDKRLSARQALAHPWIAGPDDLPRRLSSSPAVLQHNASVPTDSCQQGSLPAEQRGVSIGSQSTNSGVSRLSTIYSEISQE